MTAPSIELIESGWTEITITERCRIMSGSLRARGVPTPELEAMAPGGAKNPTTDPLGGAIVWFALLRARLEIADHTKEQERRLGQESVAAALASEPVAITLSVDGAPRAVYPKSFHALRFCDALDHALQGIVAQAHALEDVDVTALAPLTESLAVRLWAWILTHPAPDLPFDETKRPEPPEWTAQITPDDLLILWQAHAEVNRLRIARIAQLFPGDQARESRLSLAGFLGTIAQELGHRPFDVLRHWSLGEAFAQAVVASQSAREAREAAESAAAGRRAS